MSNSENELVTESSEESNKPQDSEYDLITEESIREAIDNKSNESCSGSEEDSEEDSELDDGVDEDTAKINNLTERVYKYDNMSDSDKLKNIKEYQDIASIIKNYEEIVTGYKTRLEEVEKMVIKIPKSKLSNKSVSSKTYTNTLIRFREIKEMISEENSYSVVELLNILQELKGIKQAIGSYLNKQLEIINI